MGKAEAQEKTYRIQGLSCTNCAAKFENNVKELEGVEEAKINFGASKIYVKGETTIEDLEKAGAFDHLKIRDVQEQMVKREPFWKQKENVKVFVSALLLLLSWLLSQSLGDDHVIPVVGYAASILVRRLFSFPNGIEKFNKVSLRYAHTHDCCHYWSCVSWGMG